MVTPSGVAIFWLARVLHVVIRSLSSSAWTVVGRIYLDK
jgi:ABC-type phosphate transport system auxiliary subunit